MSTSVISHRFIQTNGIRVHIAEAGAGPLVLFCHGFPESWYSWRHQLRALADAGYRAVAPDMRGYGETESPSRVEEYTILHLVGDMVGLVHALGETRAVIVGHDWGAPVAWNAALMRPDIFRAVVGMSVPFQPRREGKKPIETYKDITRRKKLGNFYMVNWQEIGAPEAEFEADIARSLRGVLYGCSASAPREQRLSPFIPEGRRFSDSFVDPDVLPAWLSQADVDRYVNAFERSGFRGPLNWYRNLDRNWELTAAFEGLRIRQPALFITGAEDHVRQFTASAEQELRLSVPALYDSVEIEGAAHWVQQEKPAEVNRALLDFLGTLRRESPAVLEMESG